MTQLEKALNKLPITKPLRKELYRGIISNNLTKVTWKELKDLRDNSQLIPGCWYRMTDYKTIVAPSNEYKSAGHQFDLIILATDVNKLSEDCKACRHEGDTYFPEDTNFEAWEVKYCIDNDASRFSWSSQKGSKYIKADIYADLTLLRLGIIDAKNQVQLIHNEHTDVLPGFPIELAGFVMGAYIQIYVENKTGDNVNACIALPEGSVPPGIPPYFPIVLNNVSFLTTEEEGKGCIYLLQDDNFNVVGHDFKNIMFKATKINIQGLIDYFENNTNNYITTKIKDMSAEEKTEFINTFGIFTKDADIPGFTNDDEEVYLYNFSEYDGKTKIVKDLSICNSDKILVKDNNLNVSVPNLNSTIVVLNPQESITIFGLKMDKHYANNNNVINGGVNRAVFGTYIQYNTFLGDISNLNVCNSFNNNVLCGDIANVTVGSMFAGNYIKAYIHNSDFKNLINSNIIEGYIVGSTIGNNVIANTFNGINPGSIYRTVIADKLDNCIFEKTLNSSFVNNDIQYVHFLNTILNSIISPGIWGDVSNKIHLEITIPLSSDILCRAVNKTAYAVKLADLDIARPATQQ